MIEKKKQNIKLQNKKKQKKVIKKWKVYELYIIKRPLIIQTLCKLKPYPKDNNDDDVESFYTYYYFDDKYTTSPNTLRFYRKGIDDYCKDNNILRENGNIYLDKNLKEVFSTTNDSIQCKDINTMLKQTLLLAQYYLVPGFDNNSDALLTYIDENEIKSFLKEPQLQWSGTKLCGFENFIEANVFQSEFRRFKKDIVKTGCNCFTDINKDQTN